MMTTPMLGLLISAAIAGLVALVVTDLTVPILSRVALAVRAVDHPGGRRGHTGTIPRLGGVGIAVGVALGAGAMAALRWEAWGSRMVRHELVAFVIATLMVFLVGLADDMLKVSYRKKFLVQFGAAGIIVASGWRFEVLGTPWLGDIHLGWFGIVVSLIWIVGVTNTINLIDGLDGLASGVVAIIALSWVFYAVGNGNYFTVVLMAAIGGGCLGFLRHNWRGRIFLGDAGSLTLGFVIAVLSVHSSMKAPAAVAILVPILALGVPVMDTLMVMVVRFLQAPPGPVSRRVVRMFAADRNHLHHLLLSTTRRRSEVVRWVYVLVVVSCGLAMAVSMSKNTTMGVIMVVLEAGVVAVVRWFGMAARMREISLEQREQGRQLLESGEHSVIKIA